MPSVSPKPGMMRRRPSAWTCAIAMGSGSGPVDLIEHAAVGKMCLLHFAPAAEILDTHEVELREAVADALRYFRQARTEVEPSRDFLRLRRIQKFQIGFGQRPGAASVHDLVDHSDRRLGQNADRRHD